MNIDHYLISENEGFPNNPDLPLLYYKKGLENTDPNAVKNLFAKNGWKNAWVDGIFSYHHFHSNVHEVLAVTSGICELQIGGEGGKRIAVEKGDVVIVPAGVAHRNVESSRDFICVGAYPTTTLYDVHEGHKEELEIVKRNIKNAAFPEKDPVFGENGLLFDYWSTRN